MRNQRRQAALKKGGPGESKSEDLITKMPYEILILILSLLPVKDAVVTSSVCQKWRFLWCGLTHLNFDAGETLNKIIKNPSLYESEAWKYIDHVNSVIRRYNHPVVHRFRISFDLRYFKQRLINEWLDFAINKKVEILELDIVNIDDPQLTINYEFDLTLSDGNEADYASLKKLYFNNVTVGDEVFEELLKRCPHLESISFHGCSFLTHIRIGGRCLNLKHFEIKNDMHVQSIFLSDFDLVSFTYEGPRIDLRLTNLPKLKEVNICQGPLGLEMNVFSQISSCVSLLQALSLTLYRPELIEDLDSIPKLPNVKKLTLTISAQEDDSLLEFASIAKACPNLQSLIIELLWYSPVKRRRIASYVANDHPFENLKHFKLLGYYGRISDLELAAYVVDNAVALKKVVIDPRCQDPNVIISAEKDLLREEAARSFVERQLKRIVRTKPPGVKLVIL